MELENSEEGGTTLPVLPPVEAVLPRPSTGPPKPSPPDSESDSSRPRSSRSSGNALTRMPKQLVYRKDEYPKAPLYNPLLANEVYRKAGANAIFEIRPAILHFAGYKVGQVMKQKVSIINISERSQRLHLLDPATKFFSMTYKKKGLIAPGMSEDVTISFMPTEWKHYSDSIKVHNSDVNLQLPIHGYPTMNDAIFPRQIDLGSCAVGASVSRSVLLECKVPIDFEFEIVPVESHPEFSIAPSKGIVPANSTVAVNVLYTPARCTTVSIQLRIFISQFGFKPLDCLVTASGISLATKKLLQEEEKTADSSELEKTFKKYKSKTPRKSASTTARTIARSNITRVDGYRIPDNLDTVRSVNYVLTQEPGRLKLNELQEAIATQRSLAEQQQAQLKEALTARKHEGAQLISVHEFDYSDNPDKNVAFSGEGRQMKELVFLKKLNDYIQHEKTLEINPTKQRTGHKLMSKEEREQIEEKREKQREAVQREEREKDRDLRQYQGHSDKIPYLLGDQKPVDASSGTGGPKNVEFVKPTFDIYNNDEWAKRKRVLDLFTKSLSKLTLRLRCDKRIKLVKEHLAGLGFNGSLPVEVPDKDVPPPEFSFHSSRVRVNGTLPISGSSSHTKGRSETPIKVGDGSRGFFPEFIRTESVPYQIPFTYKLFGYKPHEQVPAPCYVPIDVVNLARVGALEEQGIRGVTGDVRDILGMDPLPEAEVDEVEEAAKAAELAAANKKGAKKGAEVVQVEVRVVQPDNEMLMSTTALTVPAHALTRAPAANMDLVRTEGIVWQHPLLPFTEADSQYHLRHTELPRSAMAFHLAQIPGTELLYSVGGCGTGGEQDSYAEDIMLSNSWLSLLDEVADFDFDGFGLRPSALGSELYGFDEADARQLFDDDVDAYEEDFGFKKIAPTAKMALTLFDPNEDENTVDEASEEVLPQEPPSRFDCMATMEEKVKESRAAATYRLSSIVRNLNESLEDRPGMEKLYIPPLIHPPLPTDV